MLKNNNYITVTDQINYFKQPLIFETIGQPASRSCRRKSCSGLFEKKSYRILEQNYRYLKAEVDLITQIRNTVVIVEVKARTSDYFARPESAVTAKKIKLLVLAANKFIEDYNLDVDVRFDIMAMMYSNWKWTIEHIEDASYSFEG